MIRKLPFVLGTVFICLPFLSGCNSPDRSPKPAPPKSPVAAPTTYNFGVSPGNFTFSKINAGDVLRWTSQDHSDFFVHFNSGSPCVGGSPTLSSTNGVASCTTALSSSPGRFYSYFVTGPNDNQLGPRTCGGCYLQDGSIPMARRASPRVTGPAGTSVGEAAPTFINCVSGHPATVYKAAPSASGITWLPEDNADGWQTVVLPVGGKQACVETSPFNDANNTCTFNKPVAKSYQYYLVTAHCPQTTIKALVP